MKALTTKLLIPLVSFSIIACHSGGSTSTASARSGTTTFSDSIPKAPGASAAPSGPVTDGGGQILNSDEQKKWIRDYLENIKTPLKLVLHRLQFWAQSGEYPFDSVVVDGKPAGPDVYMLDKNISNSIERMTVVVQDEPCTFSGGNDRAGSADVKTQTVCFSVDEIAKTPYEDIYLQMKALAFHEVAHLLGADEDAAVRVQSWVVYSHDITSDEGAQPLIDGYTSLLEILDTISARVTSSSPADICDGISRFHERRDHLDDVGKHLEIPQTLLPDGLNPVMLATENWWIDVCQHPVLLFFSAKARREIGQNAQDLRAYLESLKQKTVEYNSPDSLKKK